MTIKVFDLFGEICITPQDGKILHDKIIEGLQHNEKIYVDFSGVSVMIATFFNHSFGLLMQKFSDEELFNLIKVQNISEDGIFILQQVIDSASKYYKKK